MFNPKLQAYFDNRRVMNWVEALVILALTQVWRIFFFWLIGLPPVIRWWQPYPKGYLALQASWFAGTLLCIPGPVSGWWQLGHLFLTARPRPANLRRGSAAMRLGIGYQNLLRIGSDPEGLYLRCWLPLLHPPLFIPWSEIEVQEPKKLLWRWGQTFVLGKALRIPFMVDIPTADRLLGSRGGPKIEALGNLTYRVAERGFFRKLFP